MPGAAKALLLFRKGWSALPQFGLVDRSAILVVGASMMPFSLPLQPKVWTVWLAGSAACSLPGAPSCLAFVGGQHVRIAPSGHKVSEQCKSPHMQAAASEEEGAVDLHLEVSNSGSDSLARSTGHQQQLLHEKQHQQHGAGREREKEEDCERVHECRADESAHAQEEYEFTAWEERVMDIVMASMRMAGLALALRAMATICLGAIARLPLPSSISAEAPAAALTITDVLRCAAAAHCKTLQAPGADMPGMQWF